MRDNSMIVTRLCADCADTARYYATQAGIESDMFDGAPTITQVFARAGMSVKNTAVTDTMAIFACLYPALDSEEV